MTQRKSTTKPQLIDPVKVCTLALKQVKCAADYNRIGTANSPETLTTAWNLLAESEQQRITDLLNNNAQPDPQTLADELIAYESALELKRVKSEYGDLVKQAWKLLSQPERDRIKALCDTQAQPQLEPETQPAPEPAPKPKPKPKTLIELTADLQQLDTMLDTIEGDIPPDLQQAVDELLSQRNATQEAMLEKVDNYAALIQSRAYWAATRKAELERLSKLIESDQKAIDFLKGRLKAHLEVTEQKKVRTKRFNISVKTAGGKQGLRLNLENPKDLPERFQRVIVEPDNTALREALEADDPEAKEVAYFAERTTYSRFQVRPVHGLCQSIRVYRSLVYFIKLESAVSCYQLITLWEVIMRKTIDLKVKLTNSLTVIQFETTPR